MIIKSIATNRINPAPYNPRKDLKPDDRQYQQLVRSIDEFGFVEPLVWNTRTGNLVGGHQRFKVLLAQGVQEVQVSVVDLPMAKEKALNIALNKISGAWDNDKLAELLDELLRSPEIEIDSMGFEMPEAEQLIADILRDNGDNDTFDVDGELESALCNELEAHLADCPNCRIMVDTVRKTITLYHRQATTQLPSDVEERLFMVLKLSDPGG